jgi:pimeloyl-ACP methyl ester carboxylesterase
MISLDDWKAGGSYFDYRGQRIFCREGGQAGAPALLLVHGFPTASWDWEALWPELGRHFRLLTLDMIGFGFSAKPRHYRYSLFDQADIFEHWLRQLGVSNYHILAHDYGVTAAQELLARQGEAGERPRLHSVCFLNGGLFPESHRPLLMQKLLLSPLGGVVAKLASRGRFETAMRKVLARQPDEAFLEGSWRLLQHDHGAARWPQLIHYITERRQNRERWVGAICQSSLPIKVINGGLDPVSGAHLVARYRELVPNPNITQLGDVGHYPQVEAPAEVLAAYLEFMQDCGVLSLPA